MLLAACRHLAKGNLIATQCLIGLRKWLPHVVEATVRDVVQGGLAKLLIKKPVNSSSDDNIGRSSCGWAWDGVASPWL